MNPSPRSPSGTHTRPSVLGDWVSVTDLGRVYGISAMHTSKLLEAAGLRLASGEASARAVEAGLARPPHSAQPRQILWHREGCGKHLERQGQVPRQQHNPIRLWADLLTALEQGSDAVIISAEEMATEIPRELVAPVNRELRQRGCSFQVDQRLRRAAAPRPACSPSPSSGATDPHPCG